MADPIPLDHDTIICHPDDAGKFAQFVMQFKIIKCSQLEQGKAYTMRGASLMVKPPPFDFNTTIDETAPFRWETMFRPPPSKPFFIQHVLPIVPAFVPESKLQSVMRITVWASLGARVNWRRAQWALCQLLDPNYRHPKAKRHA